ncbi:2-succinylbenzoate--CoA ligase [Pseudoalteromonas holothuriae]|uniref:2-succinylbenzoate--CoA ligase n=1 Tax=Pseudoalteromonas holothuriae TaxID=2963714 RepID=A0A9W4VWJ0_9GAMM|nr:MULTISPECIES: AMP-binding protein [unclassified Pseudoalteromonas]CAH9050277.1 2-succinylbenzoate--CoA ligase [Pseudoalteromonas sp. CIP111951]CAH9052389.1 2-succinylbenzoate--CoA ligase [Pseudoalteromonas sp. CIP111854]
MEILQTRGSDAQKARLKALLKQKAKTQNFKQQLAHIASSSPESLAIIANQQLTYKQLFDFLSQADSDALLQGAVGEFLAQLKTWWHGGSWVVSSAQWNDNFSVFMRAPLNEHFERMQEPETPGRLWSSYNGQWYGLTEAQISQQLTHIKQCFAIVPQGTIGIDFAQLDCARIILIFAALISGARVIARGFSDHTYRADVLFYQQDNSPEVLTDSGSINNDTVRCYEQSMGYLSNAKCFLYHPVIGVYSTDMCLNMSASYKLNVVDENGHLLANDAMGRFVANHSKTLDSISICQDKQSKLNSGIELGLNGQLQPSGQFKIDIGKSRVVVQGDSSISGAEIAAYLSLHLALDDIKYMHRKTQKGIISVAYIRCSDERREYISQRVKQLLPSCYYPDHVVFLAAFPLLVSGGYDLVALQALPLVCEQQLNDWRAQGHTELSLVPNKQSNDSCRLVNLDALMPEKGNANVIAQLNGERLTIQKPQINLLRDALLDAANSDKGVRLLSQHEQRVSYTQIEYNARCILSALLGKGVAPGDKLIFLLQNNAHFITLFWACQLGGIVPVFCEWPKWQERQQGALAKLQHISCQLAESLIIADEGVYEQLPQRQSFQNLCSYAQLQGETPCQQLPQMCEHDTALILLTSGSTGKPKMVAQTHAAVLTRSRATIKHNHFNDSDISFNWMPLDHVGGIVMFHIRDTFLAAEQIHADTDLILQQPLSWLDTIAEYQVTITWAPNFAYQLVIDKLKAMSGEYHWDLSRLHFILNAGEAVIANAAVQFMRMLKKCGLAQDAMKPTWGMSETCSGVVYNRDFDATHESVDQPYVYVGHPVPEFSIRIVDENGEPRLMGQVGELQVKGPNVLRGYYLNDTENQQAFTQDHWFKTGDLALIDEQRGLAITGRSKELIILNGVNYSCQEVEAAIDHSAWVASSYSAACPVKKADGYEGAALFVVAVNEQKPLRELAQLLRETVFEHTRLGLDYVVFLQPQQIPKSNIGKILRSQLQRDFEAGKFTAQTQSFVSDSQTQLTPPQWFAQCVLKRAPLALDYSLKKPCLHVGKPFFEVSEDEKVMPWTMLSNTQVNLLSESLLNTQSRYLSIWVTDETHWQLIELLSDLYKTYHDSALRVYIFSLSASYGLQGLVKTVSKEMPLWKLRWVHADTNCPMTWARYYQDELSDLSTVTQVAYQQGDRYRVGLKAGKPALSEYPRLPFTFGSTYLVYGGLSAVARPLIEILAERFNANVILVGRRSAAAAFAAWPTLNTHTNLHYVQVEGPLCNNKLDQLMNNFTSGQFQPLDGVIHAAGSFAGTDIAHVDKTQWQTLTQCKIEDANVLAKWLEHRAGSEGLFIQLSSVNGYFGGTAVAGYATASSYQMALSRELNLHQRLRSFCLLFSIWDKVGMSLQLDSTAASEANGFYQMEQHQALLSMLLCLSTSPSEWCIGVDPSHLAVVAEHTLTGVAQFSIAQNKADGISELDDDSGVSYLLRKSKNKRLTHDNMTVMQQQLCKLWEQNLGHVDFTLDDSYFAVGGSSIRLVQLRELFIKQGLTNASLADFFKYPTIRQFADYLESDQEQGTERKEATTERASKRKAQLARRKKQRKVND